MRIHGVLELLCVGLLLSQFSGCADDKVAPSEGTGTTPVACGTDLEVLRSTTAAKSPSGTFVDPRDGTGYPFVQAAGRDWFAANLRFRSDVGTTWCPGGSEEGCALGGRLYDWWAAAQQPLSCKDGDCAAWERQIGKGACPAGWRIPSQTDFDALIAALGGEELAGSRLKGRSGWLPAPSGAPGSGSDDQGFHAIATGSQAPSDARAPGGCSGLGSSSAFWTGDRRISLFEPTLSVWLQLASGTGGTSYYAVASEAGASIRCVRDSP